MHSSDLHKHLQKRLQGAPHDNPVNVKGKGFPVAWVVLGLALAGILVMVKEW